MFNVEGGSECHWVIETKQLALGGLQTVALPVPTGFVSKNGECWQAMMGRLTWPAYFPTTEHLESLLPCPLA